MIGADAAQGDSLVLKPTTETRSKQNLAVNRTQSISLLAQRFCERLDMCRDWAFRRSRQDYLSVDNTFHGELLPPRRGSGVHTMSGPIRGTARKIVPE